MVVSIHGLSRARSTHQRALPSPPGRWAVAMAIIQGAKLEFEASFQVCSEGDLNDPHVDAKHGLRLQDHVPQQMTPSPGSTITNITIFSGPVIFSDASWTIGSDGQPAPAGVGISIGRGNEGSCSQLCILVVSPPVTSVILAEAFSLMLATQIA